MVSDEAFSQLAAQLQHAIQKITEQEARIQSLQQEITNTGAGVAARLEEMTQSARPTSIDDMATSRKRLDFGKEMCPSDFDGENRTEFRDWSLKMSTYVSNADNDHINDALEWAANSRMEIIAEEFDEKADELGWMGASGQDHRLFSRFW